MDKDMKELFTKYADYNQLMNAHIISAMHALGYDTVIENQLSFFPSIFSTMNHIMVGDLIWLNRFLGLKKFESLALLDDFIKPTKLDQPITDNLISYQEYREALDKLIIDFIVECDEKDFISELHYTNTSGKKFSKNFGFLVSHLFNHQTHHRGQVSTLLNQKKLNIGVTDFLQVI
ncbi:MAG: damage-inducible protein DinB [Gammaproteobacteria bacterium]|nr:MAG: damage-inducible protein DinB [Gammaproteobacteria bacterium]